MIPFHGRFKDKIDFYHGTVVLYESTFKEIQDEARRQGMTDAGEICDALVDKPDSVKYEFGPAIRKARDAQAIQNNPAS